MGIAARELSQFVIRPTLLYLGQSNPNAETLLLGIAASQSKLGAALHDRKGYGLYCIREPRHAALWDNYLARTPDLASLVRGLASQHAFLGNPHLELTVNLRYATAIAWLLIEQLHVPIPATDDVQGMARIWRQAFEPQGRLRDFANAWRSCVTHHHLATTETALHRLDPNRQQAFITLGQSRYSPLIQHQRATGLQMPGQPLLARSQQTTLRGQQGAQALARLQTIQHPLQTPETTNPRLSLGK